MPASIAHRSLFAATLCSVTQMAWQQPWQTPWQQQWPVQGGTWGGYAAPGPAPMAGPSPTPYVPPRSRSRSSRRHSERDSEKTVTHKVRIPNKDLPSEWSPDQHHFDKTLVGDMDVPRQVAATRWTRERKMQGLPIKEFPVHKLFWHRIRNYELRTLAQGR